MRRKNNYVMKRLDTLKKVTLLNVELFMKNIKEYLGLSFPPMS